MFNPRDARPDQFQRCEVEDPFWASPEDVEAELLIEPPEGWDTTVLAGAFHRAEFDAYATLQATRDERGRRWQHLFLDLPRRHDAEIAEGLACEFLGAGGAWIIGPLEHPADANRVQLAFHVCSDPAAVPPIPIGTLATPRNSAA